MSTQWLIAPMGGLLGLRYEALPALMRYCRVKKKAQAQVFADLRVMERAALDALKD